RGVGISGNKALVSLSAPSLWGLSVYSWGSRSRSVRITLSSALFSRVVSGLYPESHVSGRLLGDATSRGRVPSSSVTGARGCSTRSSFGGDLGSQGRNHRGYGLRAHRFGGTVRRLDGVPFGSAS